MNRACDQRFHWSTPWRTEKAQVGVVRRRVRLGCGRLRIGSDPAVGCFLGLVEGILAGEDAAHFGAVGVDQVELATALAGVDFELQAAVGGRLDRGRGGRRLLHASAVWRQFKAGAHFLSDALANLRQAATLAFKDLAGGNDSQEVAQLVQEV